RSGLGWERVSTRQGWGQIEGTTGRLRGLERDLQSGLSPLVARAACRYEVKSTPSLIDELRQLAIRIAEGVPEGRERDYDDERWDTSFFDLRNEVHNGPNMGTLTGVVAYREELHKRVQGNPHYSVERQRLADTDALIAALRRFLGFGATSSLEATLQEQV